MGVTYGIDADGLIHKTPNTEQKLRHSPSGGTILQIPVNSWITNETNTLIIGSRLGVRTMESFIHFGIQKSTFDMNNKQTHHISQQ